MLTFIEDISYGQSAKAHLARWVFIILVTLIAFMKVRKGWSWYAGTLREDGIHPEWSSPAMNSVIWGIWLLTLGIMWSDQANSHPYAYVIDTIYFFLLVLTLAWIIALFDKRSFGAAKWIATVSIGLLGYLIYHAYLQGHTRVGVLLFVHVAILFFTVAQLWQMHYSMPWDTLGSCDGGGCCKGGPPSRGVKSEESNEDWFAQC